LDVLAFTVQVVKLELVAAAADVMYASGETDKNAFKLLSRSDEPVLAVFPDKICDGLGDMELVGVRVRILSLLKLQDRPGAKFKVLLNKILVSERDVMRLG
jgi:hypothetical protein